MYVQPIILRYQIEFEKFLFLVYVLLLESYGRPNRGGMGGFGGQRQSYHPPGLSREELNEPSIRNPQSNSTDSTSSGSGGDRPKLNLKIRETPVNTNDDRQLSERARAIFGVGRPREASPIREKK